MLYEVITLAGDFNAEPADPELGWLPEETPGWQVRSGWAAAPGGVPQSTFDPANPWAGDLNRARAIDHLFTLTPDGEPPLAFRSCERVLDRPAQGVQPSDHYGVLGRNNFV